MTIYVVTYYRLHYSPGPIVGPFNTRKEAQALGEENDQYITESHRWEVNEVCAPHVVFGNRSSTQSETT